MIKKLTKSHFVRSVATIASGTAAAQVITMLCAPLVTRIYGPEAFGVLGTFLALVAILIPLSAWAYPTAIVLPKEESDAIGLIWISITLSFCMLLTFSLLIFLGGDNFLALLGLDAAKDYIFLVPLTVLFATWVEVAQQWLLRLNQFTVIARRAVIHSVVVNGAKLSTGFFYPTASVLILISTLAYLFHVSLLSSGAKLRAKSETSVYHSDKLRSVKLTELALRHKDFLFYRAPQNFINAISQGLPVLMLATLFGSSAAGFYALGKMIVGVPSTLVGKAVGDVFYPKITELARQGGDLRHHIIKATLGLLAISIVPFGVVFALGPDIFELVFGEDWRPAGHYARWLSLFFLFNFINKPSVAAVPVLGIQRGLLVYELFSTGIKIAGLVVGFYLFKSDIWAVGLFSVLGFVAYTVMMVWIISCAKGYKGNVETSR